MVKRNSKTSGKGLPYKDLKVVAQSDFEIRTDADFPVAVVFSSPGKMKEDDEERLAHQMAAAPELLKALRTVRSAWKAVPEDFQVPDCLNVNEMWEAVDAAIAKALPNQH